MEYGECIAKYETVVSLVVFVYWGQNKVLEASISLFALEWQNPVKTEYPRHFRIKQPLSIAYHSLVRKVYI